MHTAPSQQIPAPLSVINGHAGKEKIIQQLVNTIWRIAYTALWNGEVFSTTEKQEAMRLIKLHLLQHDDLHTGYMQMAQRTLLARQYVNALPGRYIPLPSEWLRFNNSKGFMGTAEWLEKLQTKRVAAPLHRIELKVFAEAVLEMAEEPCAKHFHYWREYMIERGWQGMLNLFLATMANMEYGR